MTKCPKCGSTDVGVIDNGRWFCPKCGHEWSAGSKRGEGGNGHSWDIDYTNLEAWIKAIIVTAFIAFLIVSNPLLDGFSSVFQGVVNFLNPDNTFTAKSFVIFISAILLFFFFLYTLKINSVWPGVAIIVVLTIITSVPTILSQLLGGPLDWSSGVCMITTLNTAKCLSSIGGNVPAAEKVGATAVADVSFASSTYSLTMFRSAGMLNLGMYSIPIDVSNPSSENTVKNFYVVKAEVYNSSATMKTSEKRPLGTLTPDRCDATEKCNIAPGDEMTISLRGQGTVADTESTEAEVRVTYSYDYIGEGQNDFIFAGSWNDLKEAVVTSGGAKKFEGPVDVTVYFVPESILADSASLRSGDAYVKVYLSKADDTAHAAIRSPINIIMLYTGRNAFSAAKTCESSWGHVDISKSASTTASETDNVSFEATTLSLKQQLSCKYPYILTAEDVAYPKVVKFIARVDYSLIDKITKRGITIQPGGELE